MELTQEIVRELIDYNPETGELTFKPRTSKWFEDGYRSAQSNANIWNSIYANKMVKNTGDKHGYVIVGVLGRNYFAHRIIWLWMTGEWPNLIDHKNGIRNDNRWTNLRNVNRQENNKNANKKINNTSGYKGASLHKATGKWQAVIRKDKKTKYIGLFCHGRRSF